MEFPATLTRRSPRTPFFVMTDSLSLTRSSYEVLSICWHFMHIAIYLAASTIPHKRRLKLNRLKHVWRSTQLHQIQISKREQSQSKKLVPTWSKIISGFCGLITSSPTISKHTHNFMAFSIKQQNLLVLQAQKELLMLPLEINWLPRLAKSQQSFGLLRSNNSESSFGADSVTLNHRVWGSSPSQPTLKVLFRFLFSVIYLLFLLLILRVGIIWPFPIVMSRQDKTYVWSHLPHKNGHKRPKSTEFKRDPRGLRPS